MLLAKHPGHQGADQLRGCVSGEGADDLILLRLKDEENVDKTKTVVSSFG